MSLEETAKRLITKAEEYRALAAHHREQGESAAEAQLDLAVAQLELVELFLRGGSRRARRRRRRRLGH